MAEPAQKLRFPEREDGGAWPAQGNWTYEDYLRLPDDGRRYEVIRGVLYVSAAPTIPHQFTWENCTSCCGASSRSTT